jgi:hypothetical protein
MKAKKFALYFDSFVLCQKRKYVKLFVVGFYALLCAPTYKNGDFIQIHPTLNPAIPPKKLSPKKGTTFINIHGFWYKTRSYLLFRNSRRGEDRGCTWKYKNCGML